MERSKFYIKLLLLPILILIIVFALFYKNSTSDAQASKEPFNTPVAEQLSEEQVYKDSIILHYDAEPNWQPISTDYYKNQPLIDGQAALVVDLQSGNALYELNSRQRRKIASITKIMTAVVALEHKKIDDTMTVSHKAANIGENVMGLSEGEKYSFEDLLYGLVLMSGNDAAYTIAENTAGTTDTFIDWMNMKAKDLGLKDTYFTDPSGLDDNTYSTAADLVKLTRYALKFAEFKKVVSTFSYEIPYSDTHKYLYLENQTNLLKTYPGVAGVKTGYTEEAGLCLVTYASNDSKDVIGVVLGSTDRKGDMVLMLDYGYSVLGINIEHPALIVK
ncbi:MAG TPA: D-alanyl-D-alanine carboxypeptidase family protein [Candidatus Saccharimonadales bacterium]|nr:D-alanyl-D-alanine carboxypeptidase family protein [Candidatus Saccharimonadales bacterium]